MNYLEALEITGNLATASKMPCHTYSTNPRKCKRGCKLHNVKGSVCSKCYALRGRMSLPHTIEIMDKRMEAMQHPKWAEAMAAVILHDEFSGYFRWFSAGDLQGVDDLLNICKVARLTPKIRHWLPTHEVRVLGEFKRAGHVLPKNLTVRLSCDMLDQRPNMALLGRLGVLGGAVSTKGKHNCPAPEQGGSCCQCRKCWGKSVKTITYKYH